MLTFSRTPLTLGVCLRVFLPRSDDRPPVRVHAVPFAARVPNVTDRLAPGCPSANYDISVSNRVVGTIILLRRLGLLGPLSLIGALWAIRV
jgi:hypothetical protein